LKGLAWTLLGGGAAFGAALLALTICDLSPFRSPLEAGLARALGREVLISGPVYVRLSPYPRLVMHGVFVANADGGTHPDLLLAKQVEARLGLANAWPVRLTVRSLTIKQADLNLEAPKGSGNWLVASGAPRQLRLIGVPVAVAPSSVVLADTKVRFGGAAATAPPALVLQRAVIDMADQGRGHILMFAHAGRLPFKLDADVAPAGALVNGHPFTLAAHFSAPHATLVVAGKAAFATGGSFDLKGKGSAADTRLLLGRAALDNAATPARFSFSASSTGANGTIKLDVPQLGDGDLTADLTIQRGRHLALSGAVSATRLDLRAIAPGGWRMQDGWSVPNLSLTAHWLRHVQIDVALAAPRLSWGERRLGRIEAHLAAAGGLLNLGDLSLAGPTLSLSGDATLDERTTPSLSLSAKGHFSGADGLAALGVKGLNGGQADFALELSGRGSDLRSVMASAIGQSDVLAGGLQAGPALAQMLPSELSLGIAANDAGEDPSPLKVACLLNRLDIVGGRATSRAFFLDTPGAVTTGEGVLDLGTGAIDVHLAPRPKDPMRLADAADLAIGGTLADPLITRTDARLGHGLLLTSGQIGMVQGLGALMPLIDATQARGNPCVRLLLGKDQMLAAAGHAP
jgi:uncharacterized protein involved in outer membrane biogenesis